MRPRYGKDTTNSPPPPPPLTFFLVACLLLPPFCRSQAALHFRFRHIPKSTCSCHQSLCRWLQVLQWTNGKPPQRKPRDNQALLDEFGVLQWTNGKPTQRQPSASDEFGNSPNWPIPAIPAIFHLKVVQGLAEGLPSQRVLPAADSSAFLGVQTRDFRAHIRDQE